MYTGKDLGAKLEFHFKDAARPAERLPLTSRSVAKEIPGEEVVEWKPHPKPPHPVTPYTVYIWVLRIVALTVAAVWRRLLFRTKIIAVTGSVGKTTAKECIAAILSSRHRIQSTPRSDNHFHGIGVTLLRVRPWHRYAVIEVAIDQPGQMKWFGRVLCPDVAVWLGTARTHTREYESLAQIASEKSRLVDALARRGVAILNDDDPYVHAYQPSKHARAVRFGRDPSCAIWADGIESVWPARLAFTVHQGSRSERVETRLVGAHWVPSVLAAIVVGLECGFRLEDAVRPLASLRPFAGRLSPQVLANGAVLLRDECNGSIDTFERALEVLSEAKADRKILVISDLSDVNQRWQLRSRRIGAKAARCADVGVFVGERAAKTAANAVRAGMDPRKAFSFPSLQQAVEFLKLELRSADLVLVKGRGVDKLARLSLALTQQVTCWRPTCALIEQCDFCPELARPDQIGI
jgi:UDP-N-acetylmuramoyl-tripeptide--D-alanyl-D-alanine ligase